MYWLCMMGLVSIRVWSKQEEANLEQYQYSMKYEWDGRSVDRSEVEVDVEILLQKPRFGVVLHVGSEGTDRLQRYAFPRL